MNALPFGYPAHRLHACILDQGILLLGNPTENGVRAADMKPRLDSESRYWAEWHEYHYDKKGDMIVGKAKEINPNSKRAIQRRLLDLTQPKRTGPSSPGIRSIESFLLGCWTFGCLLGD